MSKIVYRAEAPGTTWDKPLVSPMCVSPSEAQMWFFGHYPNKRSCLIVGCVDSGLGICYFKFGCIVFKKVTRKTKFEQDIKESGTAYHRIAN